MNWAIYLFSFLLIQMYLFLFLLLLLFFILFFAFMRKTYKSIKSVLWTNAQPFRRRSCLTESLALPNSSWKRHTASPWDLYLAFAMLLIKYFINNVNILDGVGEREGEGEGELSPVIHTAIATRCSAFICLVPMILKLFIAHVSFFNQSVFGLPCSRDLDKRINSASGS